MQFHLGVLVEELFNALDLVGREIVDDVVDLFAPRLMGIEIA